MSAELDKLEKQIKLATDAKQWGQVLRFSNKYLRSGKNNLKVLLMRGDAFRHLGQLEKALDSYSQAIKLNSDDFKAYLKRGIVYFQQDEYKRSIEEYSAAIERAPDVAVSYINRGNAHCMMENFPESIPDYNKAIEIDPNNINGYYARGVAHFRMKDYHATIADCEHMIKAVPDAGEFYNLRGDSYFLTGEISLAISDYEKSLEINQNDLVAHHGIGMCYLNSGKSKEAIVHFTRVLEVQKNDVSTLINRGIAHMKDNSPEMAIEDFSLAIKIDPENPLPYRNRGLVYRQKRDHDKALADFQEVIKIDPNDSDVQNDIDTIIAIKESGVVSNGGDASFSYPPQKPGAVNMGRHKNATDTDGKKTIVVNSLDEYVQNIEVFREEHMIYRGLATTEWEITSSAERALFPDRRLHKHIHPYGKIVDKMERIIDEAVRKNFHAVDGANLSHLALLAKIQHDGVPTCFIDFSRCPLVALWFACEDKHDHDGVVVAVAAGNLMRYVDVPTRMLENPIKDFFNDMDQRQDDSSAIEENLSSFKEMNTKRYSSGPGKLWKWQPPANINARAAAQKSVFVFGRNDVNRKECTDIIVPSKCKGKILSALSQRYGINQETIFPDYAAFVGKHRYKRSDHSTSQDNTNTHEQHDAEYYFRMGVWHIQANEYSAAIENFIKSIEKDAENDIESEVAYCNLGKAYSDQRNYEKAKDSFDNAIRINGRFFQGYYGRGLAHAMLGDNDNALMDFLTAMDIEPFNADVHNSIALIYIKKEDKDKAIEHYVKAIQLDPACAVAYFNLGIIKFDDGDFDGAVSNFTQFIEIDPNDYLVYVFRGSAYSRKGDWDNALFDFNVALNMNNKSAYAHHLRGMLYVAQNNYSQAIKDFSIANEIEPDNDEILYCYGACLAETGDHKSAIKKFTAAIKINPGNAFAYRARSNSRREIGDERGWKEDRDIADEIEKANK